VSNIEQSAYGNTRGGENVQARQLRNKILVFIVIGLAIAYALFPVMWIISASLSTSNSLVGQGLIPTEISFENYETLLEDPWNHPQRPYGRWLFNSLYISTITSVVSVLISALSAYSFSRFRFRGRRAMLLTVFLVQIFSNSLTIVATFLLLQQIGAHIPFMGLDTHGGLMLVYLGGALGINTWLMKGFFDTIPRDLDEAALIDGASHWTVFWYVILPLVRPILAVVGIITFVFTYNDFILALVVLKEAPQRTLAVGLSLFIGEQFSQRWGLFSAGALMGAVPIVVIWWLLQDQVVGGLTSGAVKG